MISYMKMKDPIYFPTTSDFEKWLEENHDKKDELWVKYYKKATGKPSMSWSESVDVALCFGWIDGIRRSIDEECYMNRFTPRRTRSNWSKINLEKMKVLKKEGRIRPAGIKALGKIDLNEIDRFTTDPLEGKLNPGLEKLFQAEKEAWNFFKEQPPGYKKNALSWIMSAKREETRHKRLGILIKDSANKKRLNLLAPGR